MDLNIDNDNMSLEVNGPENQGFNLDSRTEKMAIDVTTTSHSTDTNKVNADKEGSEDNKEDLYLKFKMLIGHKRCLPDQPQQTTHISDIPPEIFFYIMNLMTGHEANEYKMLDVCACVCRSWYLHARNPLIYRLACSKLWPEDEKYLKEYGGSWQKMYLTRSHVFTHGCYIATLDKFNHLSSNRYYYLKFFSDSRVVRLATNNQPSDMLCKIKKLEDMIHKIPYGHYEFKENKLVLTFSAKNNWWHHYDSLLSDAFDLSEFNPDSHHTDFLIFKISEHNSKRHCKLLNEKMQSIWPNGLSLNMSVSCLPPFIHSI